MIKKLVMKMKTNEFPMLPSLYSDGKPRKTVTEIKCPKCEEITTRDHKLGDYVFKKVEKCKKCNTEMIINSVHDIIDPTKKK